MFSPVWKYHKTVTIICYNYIQKNVFLASIQFLRLRVVKIFMTFTFSFFMQRKPPYLITGSIICWKCLNVVTKCYSPSSFFFKAKLHSQKSLLYCSILPKEPPTPKNQKLSLISGGGSVPVEIQEIAFIWHALRKNKYNL